MGRYEGLVLHGVASQQLNKYESQLLSTTSWFSSTPDGSGTNLPRAVLLLATISAALSTVLSLWTVWLQLKNYRKITLQRFVVRILIMVPIYSISSLISLYSLDAAFFLDAVRDVYEAFVIYCFFQLLVEYLGGERSLIILLHGRPPIKHPWPISLFFPPMDVSDPFTFLGLKRGILQYVQIKPILAAITVLLKAAGTYKDGSLEVSSGYTYVSIVYNISVGLSLYCLAMFWVATHDDLQPFRPMPKFLCVKGIIFFSFWQGFAVSILVAAGLLKSPRYPTELLSLAIQDTLICFEMPLFAFLHLYAFSYTDYIDENHIYSGRLPFLYALRDAFGYKDVFSDSLTTVKGTGFSYRTFEPAEGTLHHGLGRDRRVRAGLRYAEGGKVKYWLPMPGEESDAHGRKGRAGLAARPFHTLKKAIVERVDAREGYAPLNAEQQRELIHNDTQAPEGYDEEEYRHWMAASGAKDTGSGDGDSDVESLGFDELENEAEIEKLYNYSRQLEFGDFNYPIVDASKEEVRRRMRDQEEGYTQENRKIRQSSRKEKGKKRLNSGRGSIEAMQQSYYGRLAEDKSPVEPNQKQAQLPQNGHAKKPSDPSTSADHPAPKGYQIVNGARNVLQSVLGNEDEVEQIERQREEETAAVLPPDAVDLVIEDTEAEEEEMIKDRRRGEPGGKKKRVYRHTYISPQPSPMGSQKANSPDRSAKLSSTTQKIEVRDTVKTSDPHPHHADEAVRFNVQEETTVSTSIDAPIEPQAAVTSSNALPWS